MEKEAKIYIAGHRGMVGSAMHRRLQQAGFTNFVLRTSAELDLRNQQAVTDFLKMKNQNTCFLLLLKLVAL